MSRDAAIVRNRTRVTSWVRTAPSMSWVGIRSAKDQENPLEHVVSTQASVNTNHSMNTKYGVLGKHFFVHRTHTVVCSGSKLVQLAPGGLRLSSKDQLPEVLPVF